MTNPGAASDWLAGLLRCTQRLLRRYFFGGAAKTRFNSIRGDGGDSDSISEVPGVCERVLDGRTLGEV